MFLIFKKIVMNTFIILTNIWSCEVNSEQRNTPAADKLVPFLLKRESSESKRFPISLIRRITLEISAKNKGQNSLQDTTSITFCIVDRNDNPPTFLQDNYDAFVLESAPAGTLVITITAGDLDASEEFREVGISNRRCCIWLWLIQAPTVHLHCFFTIYLCSYRYMQW